MDIVYFLPVALAPHLEFTFALEKSSLLMSIQSYKTRIYPRFTFPFWRCLNSSPGLLQIQGPPDFHLSLSWGWWPWQERTFVYFSMDYNDKCKKTFR
ncbi:hypothetical protein Syun_023429 [Stephania yunnanensis]|uniref:Uncharacterized protein n=1 Tax=Stephania yunnanensis TaxID=152371 RepID=A0AAP0FGS2_9MAGN